MPRFRPLVLVALTCALFCVPATAEDPPKKLPAKEQKELEDKWEELYERGSAAFEAGKVAEATKAFEEAHELTRRLYPKLLFPNGHPDVALGRSHLAMCYSALGKPAKAVACAEEAADVWKHYFNRPIVETVAVTSSILTSCSAPSLNWKRYCYDLNIICRV